MSTVVRVRAPRRAWPPFMLAADALRGAVRSCHAAPPPRGRFKFIGPIFPHVNAG